MGDDTLYTYTGDATSVMETFDEISGGLNNLMQDIQAVVDAASELTLLEDVLAGLANELDLLDGTATGAAAALGDVAVVSDEAATSLQTLGASSEEVATLTAAMDEMSAMTRQGAADAATLDDAMTTVGTGAADVAAQVDGLNSVIAQLSSTVAEDNQIISGLNETITNLTGQLGVLTTEETAASEGAGGLAAMMGTVGEVATTVGEELQTAQGPLLMLSMAGVMAGKSFFDMGSKAEDSLNQVQALAGVAPAAMETYTTELEAQSIKFGETLDQEAQGLYYVTSAGFANADAMKVETQAVEDARAGHVDLKISADALTSSLNAYGASADEATHYNDIMMTAVTQGKQTFGDFAAAIAQAAVTGHAVGISFDQVASAESTMTQQGFTAQRATQDLSFLMRALDLDADKVAKTAKGMGLNFNETAYKSMDLFHQLQYLKDITAGNEGEFSKLVGGKNGLLAANALLTQNADGTYKFAQNLAGMGNSAGAAANAFAVSQETISAHMDRVSATMSVLAFKVVSAIGPGLIPIIDGFSSAIGSMSDFVTQHIDIVMPILAGLAVMFGVVLVAAIAAFVIPLIAAAAPFLAVAAAIGVLVAGIALLVAHWNQVAAAIGGNPVLAAILHIIQQIGGYLASLFIPIWQQLVSVWQAQLVPAFMQLWQSIQPLLPALKLLGEIIGGGIVISIILLVAQISALLSAFAGMLPGLIRVFGGIVQVISGAIQIIIGIFTFFADLFTGKWSKLGGDLSAISQGIVTMFTGFWNIVAGLFQAATGFIGGLISGFATVIVGILQDMGVQGVNHILDMINGIVSWFEQLPGRAGAFILQLIGEGVAHFINFNVQSINLALSLVNGFISQMSQMPGRVAGVLNSLVSTALGILNGLASSALGAGAHIVEQIASGILGAIGGALGDAMASIGNFISSHLPSSPAKIGPLTNLLQQGAMITEQMSTGMLSNLPKLQDALKQMTNPIALNLNPSTLAPNPSTLPGGPSAGQGGNTQTSQYLAQMVSLLAQIVQLQQRQSGTTQQNLTFNASSGGTISPQQLYQIMQSLSGYSYEGVQRGAL